MVENNNVEIENQMKLDLRTIERTCHGQSIYIQASELKMPFWKVHFYRKQLGIVGNKGNKRIVGNWYGIPKSHILSIKLPIGLKKYKLVENTSKKTIFEYE